MGRDQVRARVFIRRDLAGVQLDRAADRCDQYVL